METQEEEEEALNQYQDIKYAVAEEVEQHEAGWLDCFRSGNKMRYRTLLGMTLQSLQQLTGANYFFYYGATIFLGVGISNSFATQCVTSSSLSCHFLVPKLTLTTATRIILNAVNFVRTGPRFLGGAQI